MLKAIEGSRKSDKAKIALERKLLEEKRAREAAEARARLQKRALGRCARSSRQQEHDLSAQFAAARA